MFINETHKFVFCHIPKTGGTSITYSLFDANLGKYVPPTHKSLRDLFKKSLRKYKDYFIFSCVRNIWDREISYFRYFSEHIQDNREVFYQHFITDPTLGFNGFIRYRCLNLRKKPSDVSRLQYEYLSDKRGKNLTNYLCTTSTLTTDLRYLFQKFKVRQPKHIRHINKSYEATTKIPCIYTKESINLIQTYYVKDFEFLQEYAPEEYHELPTQ